MENKCENCLHKGVCKLEERFKKYQEEWTLSKEVNENFEVEVKCKKFLTYLEGVRTIKKEEYSNGDYWSNKLTSTHPCEGCRVYEEIKHGKIVVGDQCYYCNHNPNKMTCGDNPETISINNKSTNSLFGNAELGTCSYQVKSEEELKADYEKALKDETFCEGENK